MMNLSMSHPVPNFGNSFTVTCYVCGMPSSKEWAQKARSRPTTPMKPYFPFLLQVTPTGDAVLREDGSTYLCAFCHASLEAQWSMYESQQVIPPPNRKYNIQKFICAVCGVETYRKRIRALPFQEFPFLEKQRQAGSITLGNNPLAVVCLDCSETLWAQSAEYDRWGLPVHKRHFNWMARPPPPEDSVEATVARLPSGETQLPRCPPTEPVLTPSRNVSVVSSSVKVMDTQIAAKARSKGKGGSPKLENSHNIGSPTPQTVRKSSLTSTTPPSLEMVSGFHNQQPPVVTVAPMSSHTTVISLRKDSMAMPSGMIAQGSGTIFPQSTTAVYSPAATYAPYVWGNSPRETSQRAIDGYRYATPSAVETIAPGPWPIWPHPTADLLRYQTYVSNLQGRARIVESSASGSPTHTAAGSSGYPGPEMRLHASAAATSTMVSGETSDEERQVANLSVSRRSGEHYDVGSPDSGKGGKRSPKITAVSVRDSEKPCTSSSKGYPTHPKKSKEMEPGRSNSDSDKVSLGSPPSSLSAAVTDAGEGSGEEQVARREYHIPKKRNWHVFMKESQSTSTSSGVAAEDTVKPQEAPVPHPKKKKPSLSECSAEGSVRKGGGRSPRGSSPETRGNVSDSVMDLSVVPGEGAPSKKSSQALKASGAKFSVEYLCQSTQGEANPGADDTVNRTSVIRCAPKVPTTENASQSVQSDNEEEDDVGHARSVVGEENDKTKEEGSRKVSTSTKLSEDAADKVKENEEKGKSLEEMEAAKKEKGEEESSEKNDAGKREQQEDSTMNTDDDFDNDTKNEDLPNIEQFIKETVLELVKREKEREKGNQKKETRQKEFLHELGLITPDKKLDLELKSIVSRHEKNTVPPLQLRVGSKLERKFDKELKEMLLKVSLQDPTLFEEKPEAEKCDFMAELGMKTAETSEKTKREIKWRVILIERMRRELRNAAARGVKHEWEKSDVLKKFANLDLDSFFNSLSYAALQASDEELEDKMQMKSDPGVARDGKEVASQESGAGGAGVCINYPKYIPSYAVAGTSGSPKSEKEAGSKDEEVCDTASVKSEDATPASGFAEPILKIPVVPPQLRLQSESSTSSTTVNSDTDDSELGSSDRKPAVSHDPTMFKLVSSGPYPLRIDSLIHCSNSYWQQMKRNIDEVLNELESSKEDIPLDEKAVHFDKLRKHLKSQLSDIKEIEKRFRTTSKVISASRKKI